MNGSLPEEPLIQDLLDELETLHAEMVDLETANLAGGLGVRPEHEQSARNLLHYVALRRHDIRRLQQQLAALGLSSLGRTESHVLAAVRAVIELLTQLKEANHEPTCSTGQAAALDDGRRLLERNTDALLGPEPEGRKVRIMVTMPSDAARDYELVRDLLSNGMNCMRINCAHDDQTAWAGMIDNLRRAEQETGMVCKVEMDVAGPKLRTGALEPGPAVIKYRPTRDAFGQVDAPARIWLTPIRYPEQPPGPVDASLAVSGVWLSHLKLDDRIRFVDARGAKRSLKIVEVIGQSRWAEATHTAYVTPGLVFSAKTGDPPRRHRTKVGPIPARQQALQLHCGETLVLTRSDQPGRPAQFNDQGVLVALARIGISLPELFDCIRLGEPIWFDDGRIGGVVSGVKPGQLQVEITHARPGGEKLAAEKGINVPETDLSVAALTEDDLKALPFIVQHADVIGFSFVRSESDVRLLREHLAELGGDHLSIVLKIETRQGFDNLPQLLFESLKGRAVGVMIARGDLAVECGYQRLAEIQEEILWISEAAHVPVIWATQVLESLAKTGMPSRSEITDAAMGERAECVMLNKGPFVVRAVKVLDDILRRMQDHQAKKTSMLRKLNVATAFAPRAAVG
jgi:pyruvate kinase